MSAPYDWADTVKPLGKAPRLCPTLVLSHTPRELADKLEQEERDGDARAAMRGAA